MNNSRPPKLLLFLLLAALAQTTTVTTFIASSFAAAPAAPTTAPSDLLAHGSAEMYWIARIGPASSSSSSSSATSESFIQSRHIGGDPRFKLVARYSAARVVSLTSRGNQLAVLLDNGDWRLIWETESSGGALPDDGSKLLALAGAPDVLWAIGSAGEGIKPTSKPTTSPATQPATTMPAAGTKLLYKLDQGRWKMISPLPPSVGQAIDLSLAVVAGKPALAILLDSGQVRTYGWNDGSGSWESSGEVDAGDDATRVKVLGNLDRLALWTADAHGPGQLFLRDDKWGKPIPLTATGPKGGPIDTNAKDVTVAGQSVRLLALADGKLTEFTFATDGTPQGTKDLPVPTAPSQERPFDWVNALAAAMLMLVLVHSVRRRGTTPPEVIEAAGLKLAPYGLRLLAGTIDALPVVGTFFIILLRLDEADRATEAAVTALLIPLQIATGVYVLMTLASELMWGWTIGKKLCGLRVVMLDGSAPTRRAFVIRNILRIVDAGLLFPLLLVFLSPLRQRVGDAAAETVVVMGAPAAEQPPTPKE
jgi:uncharacterized RDD family membrane protein YckC